MKISVFLRAVLVCSVALGGVHESLGKKVMALPKKMVTPDLKTQEFKAPQGFWAIPGVDTALKLSGFVKLDTIYDANCHTGDAAALPLLPLRGFDQEARRRGIFRMHAKASRLVFESYTATASGPVTTRIAVDFFGLNNFGNNSISRSDVSANAFTNRIREAYGTYAGWLIGQTNTTFYDADAWGTYVEFNGPNSIQRQPMIRYTYAINNRWTMMAAAEYSHTEYTNEAGVLSSNAPFVQGQTGLGYRSFPDLILAFKYKSERGDHISLRFLGREQSIRRSADTPTAAQPNILSRVLCWGVGLSGRVKSYDKNAFYAQFNAGRGIGHYLFEAPGQAMALTGENFNVDGPAGPQTTALTNAGIRFKAQYAYVFLMGYEHHWTEKLKSNFTFAYTKTQLAKFVLAPFVSATGSGVLPVTKSIRHLVANVIYTPTKNVDVGFEYNNYRREATGNFSGVGNRFQLGVWYRF